MKPEDSDPAIEGFARVTPPAGHAGRVRARSGPGATGDTRPAPTEPALPLRWLLPVAASVMVVIGAAWQSDRASRQVWFEAPPTAPQWSGKGVDVPVLPPRAYWTMSAFDEFSSLRGVSTSAGARIPTRSAAAARPGAEDLVETVAENADAERPWVPLPPIEIEDIAPAPIEMPAVAGLEPLALEPIEILPLEIIPVDKEER